MIQERPTMAIKTQAQTSPFSDVDEKEWITGSRQELQQRILTLVQYVQKYYELDAENQQLRQSVAELNEENDLLQDSTASLCNSTTVQQATTDQSTATQNHSTHRHEREELLQKIAKVEELLQVDIDSLLSSTNTKVIPFATYDYEHKRRIQAEEELQRLSRLYSNVALKPAQKIGLHLLQNAVERGQTHDDEGRTRVNATTISKKMGMSRSTGDRLIEFCKKQLPGLLDVAQHTEALPDGTETPRTYIKFADLELLHHPENIIPLDIRKQGGDRYTCQLCGSNQLKIRRKVIRTLVCLNPECKHEVLLDEKETERILEPIETEDTQKQVAFTRYACNIQSDEIETSINQQIEQNMQKQVAFESGSNQMPPSIATLYNLYHIGYRRTSVLDEIDQALAQDRTTILADIRYTPQSRNPEWTQAAFTKRYKKQYTWIRALGNTKHKEGTIDIANAEAGIAQLIGHLQQHPVILMCGCQAYEECHTKTVIELFQQAISSKFLCSIESNLPHTLKPDTPPHCDVPLSGYDDEHVAAQLLLDIGGDAPQHIEMSDAGEKKYYSMEGRLSLDDALDHLRGGHARGALCSRTDGLTRSLAWDSDNEAGWEVLSCAARLLAGAGFLPLLEKSPANRGGHLWLIYSDLVCANTARRQVCDIAPELLSVQEYWPGPVNTKWNRVRLLGGRYVRRGMFVDRDVDAWCALVSVADGEECRSGGPAAAALLINHQTPATLVPVSCDQYKEEVSAAGLTSQRDVPPVKRSSRGHRVLPDVDSAWVGKYGAVESTTLWFAITEGCSAAWFNNHHTLESIRPLEKNKMALSPNGSERTASTDYWESADGERYTDYSQHGKLVDGRRDTGDALELAVKVWSRSKASILAEVAKDVIKQARTEMEAAACSGQQPSTWVSDVMTPAGWRRYDSIATHSKKQSVVEAPVVVQQQQVQQEEVVVVQDKSNLPTMLFEPEPSPIKSECASTSAFILSELDQLDVIKAYGQAHEWPAFVLEDQEVIGDGRASWLQFIWLAGSKDLKHQVYAAIQRCEEERSNGN